MEDQLVKSGLSENESIVLHSLIKWPKESDQAIHSRIGFKKSTFSSIKTRLKENNYFSRYYVPNFPYLGCEMFNAMYGKLNRYTTFEERMRIARDTLESFIEDFYIVSESNKAFNLSVSQNLTEFEKNQQEFFELYTVNNFLSRKGMTTVYFPFELTNIYSFLEFESLVGHIFGLETESYNGRTTIPREPIQNYKLTTAERKVLVGLIQYPEESDTLIADEIGVSRNTVANAKRKFLKNKICFPRVVPNLEKLGLEVLNFTYFKANPSFSFDDWNDISENIRKIMSPHLFMTKKIDAFFLSAHNDEYQFSKEYEELMRYFRKEDITIEDPVDYQIQISEMHEITEYDFLPIIKKILGFDFDIPVSEQ